VLVEMALRENVGATLAVPADLEPFVFLFSESTARAVVTVDPGRVAELEALATGYGVPVARVGVVTGPADDLQVDLVGGESVLWTLDELRAAADATLPALFG